MPDRKNLNVLRAVAGVVAGELGFPTKLQNRSNRLIVRRISRQPMDYRGYIGPHSWTRQASPKPSQPRSWPRQPDLAVWTGVRSRVDALVAVSVGRAIGSPGPNGCRPSSQIAARALPGISVESGRGRGPLYIEVMRSH